MPHAAPADLTVDGAVTYETKFIPLSDIKIPADRMRSPQGEEVDRLAESFQEVGQLQPIVVRRAAGADHTYWLVLGRRRFEAARDEIRASVVEGLDADRLELAEIDENLIRAELSASERSKLQLKRMEIFQRLHPETGAGGDRRSKSQLEILNKSASYIDVAAAETGRSRATIAREVHRGKNIPDIAAIVGTSLDKGVELDALAKLTTDQQAPLIAKAKAGKKVSAKPEAVKAERKAKRKEKHKKKLEERQAQERAQREEEEMAREERAHPAVAFLREHLNEEQLVQFHTLVDGYWDDFGKVLQRETENREEHNAAPGFGDEGEPAKSLVGRVAQSGIATDSQPSTILTIPDTDAPEMFAEIDPSGSGPEPAAQDGLQEIANVDSEEGAGHVAP